MTDPVAVRLVVGGLLVMGLVCLAAITVLSYAGVEVPDVFGHVVTGCMAAVAGILARTSSSPPE